MSIYIKGVGMPKAGSLIVVFPSGDVWSGGTRIAKAGTAIEVKPHGALKDADALLTEIKPDEPRDLEWAATGRTIKEIMRHRIQAAPTIIPADREEEEQA